MNNLRLLLFFSLLLISCGPDAKAKKENEGKTDLVEIRVTKAMGQAMSDSIKYLPLIGNLAEAKLNKHAKHPYLVLGKDIENGDNFLVRKIATLVYSHNDVEKRLILAFPDKTDHQSLDATNFNEFATKYISVKWQLESWYNHFGGLGKSKFIKWELL